MKRYYFEIPNPGEAKSPVTLLITLRKNSVGLITNLDNLFKKEVAF